MLDLRNNRIDDRGAEHLAHALEKNKVTMHARSWLISVWSLQALLFLHLDENGIGDEGAQYLAHALETNRVTINDCIPIHFTLFFL